MKKLCTTYGCTTFHETKWATCESCREFNKLRERRRRNSKTQQITDLCERNIHLKVCKDILNIINGGK